MRKNRLRWILYFALVSSSMIANADWHLAKINDLYIGYDGQTTSITLTGFSKSNCTCYPTWSDRMCLDRTRASYKDEVALLLLAKSAGMNVNVNINEGTCQIVALGLH